MNSNEFYTRIMMLIDTYGSDAVLAAARHIEKPNQKYPFISRNQYAFRNTQQKRNAAAPKRYKDLWITQDYPNANKKNIYHRLQHHLSNKYPI